MAVSRKPNAIAEQAGIHAAARGLKRRRVITLRWRYFCRAYPKETTSGFRQRALSGKKDTGFDVASMFVCYRNLPHKYPPNIKARKDLDKRLEEAGLGHLVERRKAA